MGPMSNVGVIESHFGQKLDAYKDQTGVIPEKISSAIAEVNVACLRRIVEAEAEEEGKVVDSDIDVKKLKNDVERWEASFDEPQGSGDQTASSTGRSFGQTSGLSLLPHLRRRDCGFDLPLRGGIEMNPRGIF